MVASLMAFRENTKAATGNSHQAQSRFPAWVDVLEEARGRVAFQPVHAPADLRRQKFTTVAPPSTQQRLLVPAAGLMFQAL